MAEYMIQMQADVSLDGDGRKDAILAGYRPNLVIDGNYCLCFLVAPPGPIAMGARSVMDFDVVMIDHVVNLLIDGASFELREGAAVVGHGTVLSTTGLKPIING